MLLIFTAVKRYVFLGWGGRGEASRIDPEGESPALTCLMELKVWQLGYRGAEAIVYDPPEMR